MPNDDDVDYGTEALKRKLSNVINNHQFVSNSSDKESAASPKIAASNDIDSYKQSVSGEPLRQDYHPSKFRQFMSSLAGIGAGLQGENGAAARDAVLYRPYNKQLQNYQQGEGIKQKVAEITAGQQAASAKQNLESDQAAQARARAELYSTQAENIESPQERYQKAIDIANIQQKDKETPEQRKSREEGVAVIRSKSAKEVADTNAKSRLGVAGIESKSRENIEQKKEVFRAAHPDLFGRGLHNASPAAQATASKLAVSQLLAEDPEAGKFIHKGQLIPPNQKIAPNGQVTMQEASKKDWDKYNELLQKHHKLAKEISGDDNEEDDEEADLEEVQ